MPYTPPAHSAVSLTLGQVAARPPHTAVDLQMGDAAGAVSTATLGGTLTVRGSISAGAVYLAQAAGVLRVSGATQGSYDMAVFSGLSTQTGAAWDVADAAATSNVSVWAESVPTTLAVAARHGDAPAALALVGGVWSACAPANTITASPWDHPASALGIHAQSAWDTCLPAHTVTAHQWGQAIGMGQATHSAFQYTRPLFVPQRAAWGAAIDLGTVMRGQFRNVARPSRVQLAALWGQALALASQGGLFTRFALPVPPTPPVLYELRLCRQVGGGGGGGPAFIRTDGQTHVDVLLVIGVDTCAPQPGTGFVVPIKRVYLVINSSSLRRVDGNFNIPTFGMSLSLDAGSWTWQFSASVPASALSLLEPGTAGSPVEVEALVNGLPHRVLIESISRERAFAQASIRVSGRGIGAVLDAPYSPVSQFGNSSTLTAQQLATQVLTINNVPFGWNVNWGLTDWLIPAGAFSHTGSYISAITSIAAAAGGYLQPSATAQTINVLPMYKKAPWNWATDIVPDFQIPADVAVRESIEWVERARYDRVYVSGQAQGVLGRVTRAGTSGSTLSPMIVDALITDEAVARQRGIAVLSNVGRIANVGIKMPVLPETGVLVPGKYLDFVDTGVTRRGVVRSVQVDVGQLETWQTIGIETHA